MGKFTHVLPVVFSVEWEDKWNRTLNEFSYEYLLPYSPEISRMSAMLNNSAIL